MGTFRSATLRQIHYFIAVAEHGSFRRAADYLDVTQPTLTSQVSALEEVLGVSLLERSHSGATLSPAGRELLPHARRVIEESQGFLDMASTLAGTGGGTYRLGVTPTLGPYLLPAILPKIHAEFPGLKFYVREAPPSDLEEELKDARHDLILTTLPIMSRELAVDPLFREPLKLAIAREHRLAKKARINRMDLHGEEVLTIGEHHLFHRQISDLCESLGANMRRDYEGTSLDTLRHMVVMGMGLAFLPALYVKSEIRPHDVLRIADVNGVSVFRNHALVWRPTSPGRVLFRQLADRIRSLTRTHLGDSIAPLRA
jgi:LysR family hydrogen peroxide-inducible transcriptional activator